METETIKIFLSLLLMVRFSLFTHIFRILWNVMHLVWYQLLWPPQATWVYYVRFLALLFQTLNFFLFLFDLLICNSNPMSMMIEKNVLQNEMKHFGNVQCMVFWSFPPGSLLKYKYLEINFKKIHYYISKKIRSDRRIRLVDNEQWTTSISSEKFILQK